MFDRLGREVGVLEPPADGKRHIPVYVAINPADGSVWVTDRAAGEIYAYDSQGTYLRTFTPTETILNWQPLGIAFSMGQAPAPELRLPALAYTLGIENLLANALNKRAASPGLAG